MIRDVAELLRGLQEAEALQIERAGIRHAPTIGEAYEGLTASILQKTIPANAGLSIVSGFVEDSRGAESGQIDCMLVSGSGTPIPHTKHFKWHVKDVVAVLEIKKRLFSAELADAHDQLRGVLEVYGRYIQSFDDGKFDISPTRYAFGQITGRVAPERKDLRKLLIPMKVVTDSDLIPVSDSDAMPVAIGAKRRWPDHSGRSDRHPSTGMQF